jgi:hypothetical protein
MDEIITQNMRGTACALQILPESAASGSGYNRIRVSAPRMPGTNDNQKFFLLLFCKLSISQKKRFFLL